MQIGHTGLAFIKDWAAKKRVPFNIQHHFGQTFGLLEEVVRLKTGDCSQGIKWIRFSKCNDIVRNRIDPEFALIKVLHHKCVA